MEVISKLRELNWIFQREQGTGCQFINPTKPCFFKTIENSFLFISSLLFRVMLLPLKLQSLGQCNTKSRQLSKKGHFDRIIDSQISFKFIYYNLLLILGGTFIVPNQCCIPNLQLHSIKKLWNIFYCIVFLFVSAEQMSQIFQIQF